MESLFVPYEIALALKELGFDEPCFGWYSHMYGNVFKQGYCETYLGIENCAKAPLYSQAFRWFREKHGIFSSIWCFETEQKFFIEFGFGIQKFEVDNKEEIEVECLSKLIEIVKNSKLC